MFQEHWMQDWKKWQIGFDVISKPVLILISFAALVLNLYQFYTYRNRERNIKGIQTQIETLQLDLKNLQKQHTPLSEKYTLKKKE